jgi:hypothetical protein
VEKESAAVMAAVIAGLVALVTAAITSAATLWVAERRTRRDFALEFAAERIARELMMHPTWQWRSFATIKHYLGGFVDDELRTILVRAGAIRTTSAKGTEIWGLLDRNRSLLAPKDEPAEFKECAPS